jgi:hypothetical protein
VGQNDGLELASRLRSLFGLLFVVVSAGFIVAGDIFIFGFRKQFFSAFFKWIRIHAFNVYVAIRAGYPRNLRISARAAGVPSSWPR